MDGQKIQEVRQNTQRRGDKDGDSQSDGGADRQTDKEADTDGHKMNIWRLNKIDKIWIKCSGKVNFRVSKIKF